MIINESGAGYVCQFTGIISADAVEMVWGVDQHPPHKQHRSCVRKTMPTDQERMPAIRAHISAALTLYLNNSKSRLDTVANRRDVIIQQRATSANFGPNLIDIITNFYIPNKALFEPIIITPVRHKWLVTTISDYMYRLVGISFHTSRKKIYAFVATCILRLVEGCVDTYNIVVFPRVPWLEGMFFASDVGRVGDIKCGVQEKMWTEMQKMIGFGCMANAQKIFQQPYTEDVPE
jgi:hypothetical protein